jgi:two-component system, NtrC family, response regulator
MEKLLIVDDSEEIRKQLKWGLGKDYEVLLAKDGREAIFLYRKNHPKVVMLDLGLPPDEDGTDEGFKCLEGILKSSAFTKVIVVTGNDERHNALKAVQLGAYDFYQKPVNLEELRIIIGRAFHLSALEEENRSLHIAMGKSSELSGVVGHCPEMLDVFSTVRKVASSDASILIVGESGTGKEMISRAIHSMSLRKDYPFIAINCGAIPEHLLESELFGHEKGAFTGAHAQVQGRFEYADKGTLFLDEIGELSLSLQVKLLRFLQERIIQRVGGREDIHVDTRILAATSIDLAKAIKEGKFREDLYYRIAVITVKLPPLRDRKDDILLLANLFLRRFCDELKKKVIGFSPASIELLETYQWPGNVRELENKIQRSVIMCETSVIEPQDFGIAETAKKRRIPVIDSMSLKEAKALIERELIISSINRHKGNLAQISEELEISRPTLYDLMRKHGLNNIK